MFVVTLLVASLLFFVAAGLILIHNLYFFRGLKDHYCGHQRLNKSDPPSVSILIPARNEEDTLPRLLDSLLKQDYPISEILVLDDASTDKTREVVLGKAESSAMPIRIHTGMEKPDSWMGKNWACHQLSQLAKGDIFIFLDADTWLHPETIGRLMERMLGDDLDFATVWPHQIMTTWSEKMVIPTVYSTIPGYLPTRYSYRAPRWIPSEKIRTAVKPLFATACGQCLIFRKDAYFETGGHAAVKSEVVEDVMLAKNIVRAGKTMKMFHGTDRIWCRMYRNHKEVFSGFRKNFFAGFGYRYLPFMLAWLLHIAVYLMPPVLLVLALLSVQLETVFPGTAAFEQKLITWLSVFAVSAAFLQRATITFFMKWPSITAMMHLPGILWFQMLAIVVISDRLGNRQASWKGRKV